MADKTSNIPKFFRDLRADYGGLFDTTNDEARDKAIDNWNELPASEQRYHIGRLLYAQVRGQAVISTQLDALGELVFEGVGRISEAIEGGGAEEDAEPDEAEAEPEPAQVQQTDDGQPFIDGVATRPPRVFPGPRDEEIDNAG